ACSLGRSPSAAAARAGCIAPATTAAAATSRATLGTRIRAKRSASPERKQPPRGDAERSAGDVGESRGSYSQPALPAGAGPGGGRGGGGGGEGGGGGRPGPGRPPGGAPAALRGAGPPAGGCAFAPPTTTARTARTAAPSPFAANVTSKRPACKNVNVVRNT